MSSVGKWVNKNKFIIFLFIFSFVIRLFSVLFIDNPVVSDFKLMYDASIELINGSRDYLNTNYFLMWAYQMGHVLYQSLLLRIINSITFLKVINCIVTSFTVVYIYLISSKLCSDIFAKISSLFYSVFLFPLLLNNVLTNQLLPMLLVLIAIYKLINIDFNKFILNSFIIGLLLCLSNILRSEGIVFIFSIMLYYLFLIIKKYNIKKLIYSFLIIFLTYFMLFNSTSYILKKSNVSINGLNNMNTTFKFVLGFNYETNGRYSDSDASLYSNNIEESKKIVKKRVSEYQKIPKLFINKVKILWFSSDLSWSLDSNSSLFRILSYINKLFILILDLFSFISLFNLFKNKFDNKQILITLILLVYFGVYLLIEVMPRYAYSIQIFQTILLGIGLELTYKIVSKSIYKNRH